MLALPSASVDVQCKQISFEGTLSLSCSHNRFHQSISLGAACASGSWSYFAERKCQRSCYRALAACIDVILPDNVDAVLSPHRLHFHCISIVPINKTQTPANANFSNKREISHPIIFLITECKFNQKY